MIPPITQFSSGYRLETYVCWCNFTFYHLFTHTCKIRTRPEKQFRGPWTLAAEDTWMLKVVLINADCSTVRWDMNSFIRLSNIRMPVPDAFIIMLPIHLRSLELDYLFFLFMGLHLYVYFVVQYNYIFLFGIPLISIFILCLYFASYYFWNAVNQHLTLYLLCQLLLSGILLISILMIKFCDDMDAAWLLSALWIRNQPSLHKY
mgnify:CR=1 FL=1